MDMSKFLSELLRDTSKLSLAKLCGEARIGVKDAHDAAVAPESSSIQLMGPPGRIVLRCRYDLEVALKWSKARSESDKPIGKLEAIDLMREYTNLHAGTLSGLFDQVGIVMGMSLPLSTSNVAPKAAKSVTNLPGKKSYRFEWLLSDGSSSILCIAEVELGRSELIESVYDSLEKALKSEVARGAKGGGGVEFF
jgi:hypothetical protein